MTLKLELGRLCKIEVLKKINHSEWAASTFIIPKIDGRVQCTEYEIELIRTN